MKKILIFISSILLCITHTVAAVRDENSITRQKTNTVNSSINSVARTTKSRTSTRQSVTTRQQKTNASQNNISNVSTRKAANTRQISIVPQQKNISARSTTTVSTANETNIGTVYEQCKNAFFDCMDQFCKLKSDTYRRCSCSDRVFDFEQISENYKDVSNRLTEFSDNIDAVSLTKEQALAMKTASEGELALSEDKSASKQLLQAIMNAISGEDSSVTGKYEQLNSVSLSTNDSNAFGMSDSSQIIASYNGSTLYKSVYPTCKNTVQNVCNDASLQRAINAYLMSIEQDCNTVESALQKQQKELKSATHQSSAMLDLARVENRQNHNSDDIATCMNNVESSITDENVCGEHYYKCLDYGQYIDISTGAPLTGVVDFYKLGELLTFKASENIQNQKLSSISNNRTFVQYFENKTKQFAQEALDKCTEDADTVWSQYLDKALLDIYYAQQSKVDSIQQSCIDLISSCYETQSESIAQAMANLTGDSTLLLQPSVISLTSEMCSDYIESCNNMFGEDTIKEYIAVKNTTDTKQSCRDIAKQCFEDYGGTEYVNFYNLQSGLFTEGTALDWFTLYDSNNSIVSPCAKLLSKTTGCETVLEDVFGGFSKNNSVYTHKYLTGVASEIYNTVINNLETQCSALNGVFISPQQAIKYGYKEDSLCNIDSDNSSSLFYLSSGNNASLLSHYYTFNYNENMCPQNYITTVDTSSWGICSCWENGGRRSKNGTSSVCSNVLLSNTNSDSDILCTKNNIANVSNNSQSWCIQDTVSSYNQVCPYIRTNKTKKSSTKNNIISTQVHYKNVTLLSTENDDEVEVVECSTYK